MMYVKIKESVVAVCDEDILGKTFEDDNVLLEIKEEFYKGDLKDKKQVINILKDAINVNLVGKEAIKTAIDAGVIEEENVLYIQGVPYALMCKL